LPVAPSHHGLAVDLQEDDAASPLRFTRALLAARRRSAALVGGALEPLDLPAPLLGYDRVAEGARVRCLFNLSGEAAAVPPALAAGIRPLDGAPVPGVPETLGPWGIGLGRLG